MNELAVIAGDPRPKGDGEAIVYMSAGWWVAMCGRPFCMHAEWFGPALNGAGVGGLTETRMICPACGWHGPAVWPSEELRKSVTQLLADRPDPATRNWFPHETPSDLLWENVEHGIVPRDALAALEDAPRGGKLLAIAGDEIVAGARALPAPGRLAIAGGQ